MEHKEHSFPFLLGVERNQSDSFFMFSPIIFIHGEMDTLVHGELDTLVHSEMDMFVPGEMDMFVHSEMDI